MFGDSHALCSDSRPLFPLPREDLTIFPKQTEQRLLFMESNTPNSDEYKKQSSGLLRFRSAPSSFLENFLQKSERLETRFEGDGLLGLGNHDEYMSNDKMAVDRFTAVNSHLPPQYPRQNSGELRMDGHGNGGYGVVDSSMGMDRVGPGRAGSGLMRQNSLPAGLFSQNGYGARKGFGNCRMADNGANGNLSPSSGRLKNHMNYFSGMPSSLGLLSRINEVEIENSSTMDVLNEANVGLSSGGDGLFYSSEFPFGSWNDSSMSSTEKFIKREINSDQSLYSNTQNGEAGNWPYMLPRHSSLPKTSSEIGAVEKKFHLQDFVPCKIRAKRGCATHPRSIAERLRRTRISERMRKLQELVPNMEQQINTADMLDLVVDYLKTLQKEFKTLCENQANCKCSAFQKTVRN